MTPKEKASELIQQFTDELFNSGHEVSKPLVRTCASIACKQLIKEHSWKHPISWNNERRFFYENVFTEIQLI